MNKINILILLLSLCELSLCANWVLKWHPDAATDGLKGFEGEEEDRGNVNPVKHIYTEGSNYRVDIYVKDRDSSASDSDRQRSELKGMVQGGTQHRMKEGETWKITYSMYIPSTLKATTSFTHIAQMKVPNADSENLSPIYVMSLRRSGTNEYIEAQVTTGSHNLGHTDLIPLHEKWIDVELEYYVHASKGYANLTLSSAGKSVFNGKATDVKTFFVDTVRPKWGIYRSISDSAQLHDSYLLLTDFKGYIYE